MQGCTAEKWDGQAEPELLDDRKQIIDPHTAYQMTSILEGVIQRGTATVFEIARTADCRQDRHDERREGRLVHRLLADDGRRCVHVGYDTPKPMGKGNTGGVIAAPIFGEFMKEALWLNTPPAPFRVPPGIKFVRVNLKTGLRAAANDPDSIIEAFKPDEEPDDAYAMIGITNATADASTANGDARIPPPPPRPETATGGQMPDARIWSRRTLVAVVRCSSCSWRALPRMPWLRLQVRSSLLYVAT